MNLLKIKNGNAILKNCSMVNGNDFNIALCHIEQGKLNEC
ncbi:protein of unknown function [Moritella yayanosii]|uniref:Uncharacterized protein n=1 Tax=Moritella yayanosii TaxID=69539 RepID=A0A330LUG2_9GAMM|nr:protein of unknown function [Moritella yayanosii]